jgi:hypothetical protein
MNTSLMSPEGENVVFLLGAPRSGTTWLAKVLDSHPDVLYRHEPDTVLRNENIPYLCPREEVGLYRDEARRYLEVLLEVRSIKSAGSRPLFPKNYRRNAAGQFRNAIICGLLGADAIFRGAPWLRRIVIPDLIAANSRQPTIVLKSVSSRGRALLFARAFPASRLVFILRHPCGQVASMVRYLGDKSSGFEAVLEATEAKQLGLTASHFASLTLMERCAWHWAILNQKALNDLSELGNARVDVLRYEDACANPEVAAKDLVAFAGLDWSPQTASFVQASTTAGDTDHLHRISRNSVAAANRWRRTLSGSDQRRILDIVTRVPVGEMFGARA